MRGETGEEGGIFFVLFLKLEEIIVHLYSDENEATCGENLTLWERGNCWSDDIP